MLALLLAAGCGEIEAQHSARPAQSVLLLTTDAAHGARRGVFDALAARGVRFDDCHAIPHGGATLTEVARRSRSDGAAIARAFRAAGYHTLAVLGPAPPGADPLNGAFDRLARVATPADEAGALARLQQWVAAAEDQPVFAWVHLPAAERALGPTARESLDPADAALPAVLRQREVVSLDARFGALLDHARLGTGVVALTLDRGGSFDAAAVEADPAHVLDGQHAPLVIAWPGAPAGRRVRTPVDLADLAPTLLALVDAPAHDVVGRDLTREVCESLCGGGSGRGLAALRVR